MYDSIKINSVSNGFIVSLPMQESIPNHYLQAREMGRGVAMGQREDELLNKIKGESEEREFVYKNEFILSPGMFFFATVSQTTTFIDCILLGTDVEEALDIAGHKK